jgi:hypothetical protein
MIVAEMMVALKVKYPPPQYATLFEVRNQTGFAGPTERYADAVCLDLYPSKGLFLSGFEFKTSRQDLMNDLQNPSKHLEIAQHCNYWWLAIGDQKIIKEGELPESWGLMVPRGKNLIIRKQAPFREVEAMPISFVASLLRSALRSSPVENEITMEIERALKNERSYVKKQVDYNLDEVKYQLEHLNETVEKFETASGVKLQRFRAKQIGEAVKFVMAGGLDGMEERIAAIKTTAEKIVLEASALEEVV